VRALLSSLCIEVTTVLVASAEKLAVGRRRIRDRLLRSLPRKASQTIMRRVAMRGVMRLRSGSPPRRARRMVAATTGAGMRMQPTLHRRQLAGSASRRRKVTAPVWRGHAMARLFLLRACFRSCSFEERSKQ
jgi:hypothetical protein